MRVLRGGQEGDRKVAGAGEGALVSIDEDIKGAERKTGPERTVPPPLAVLKDGAAGGGLAVQWHG